MMNDEEKTGRAEEMTKTKTTASGGKLFLF